MRRIQVFDFNKTVIDPGEWLKIGGFLRFSNDDRTPHVR